MRKRPFCIWCLVIIGQLVSLPLFGYNEAPMFRERVKAGKLPPLEQRLPQNPVVQPVEEIGRYGGTLRVATLGPYGFAGDPQSCIGPETLLRINPDYQGIGPGIAKGYEFRNGSRTLILKFHEGIKWSDGVPFTADDLLFWYEDVVRNKELTPVKPVNWSPGGELMKMKKIDDYTIQMDFAVPYPIAINLLAHYPGSQFMFAPKHYMKQFHPNYVDRQKLEQMARASGHERWYQLFNEKGKICSSIPCAIGLPTLSPFVIRSAGAQSYLFERNPYYWRVDPAGNQLPYIDRVRIFLLYDAEMINLKILCGELDLVGGNALLNNYPLYKMYEEKGNYRLIMWKSVYAAEVSFQLNQTHKDPVLRKIFRDLRFRKAVSLGINRQDINNVLYFGLAKPRQSTLLSISNYFEPAYETAYIAHDPAEANRLLDEMGLNQRDSKGFRLRPDGKRLTFMVEHTPGFYGPICEISREHWREVGLDVRVKEISGELQKQRAKGNLTDVTVWHMDKSMDHTFIIYPVNFVPYNWHTDSTWGTAWAIWYQTGGRKGEEPPTEMKRLFSWWERMRSTTDATERLRLGKQLLQYQAEHLLTIGTVGEAPIPIVVNKDLGNIPESGIYGYDTIRMQPNHPETFFFR